MVQKTDSKAVFGAITFFAKKHPGELCGSNGLPLTPNSITIYGESQILKSIVHPNLCEYLEIIRGKHERIIVVSEYHTKSIRNSKLNVTHLKELAHSVISGLVHINQHGIVHRSLSPDNILITRQGAYKLFNYGLYHMTNHGTCVSFPIGSCKYLAPEIILCQDRFSSGPKADVWSFGLILAELSLGKDLWSTLKLRQIIQRVVSSLNTTGTILERIVNEHSCWDAYKSLDPELIDFLNSCLEIDIQKRLTPEMCLQHPYLQEFDPVKTYDKNDVGYHIGFLKRVSYENVAMVRKILDSRKIAAEDANGWPAKELAKRSLKEQYYLWQLAGGDAYAELKRQGMIKTKPPMLTLPNMILLEGTAFGQKRDFAHLLDLRVVMLSMDNLHRRLSHLPFSAFHPLLITKSAIIPPDDGPDATLLPLVIREKDIEYQFHRVVRFQRFLLGYPSNREVILKEASKDVTPLFRGDIWASILGIKGDIQGIYDTIDKETPSYTDRQIDVDIPRCHQYNELLASGAGHRKLKRVLKAWVKSHPQYVYWQGLDSLCAPFLYLNFNNEAQAYACLSAFIPKYLNDFFLKDNALVIQEYLAKFRHLVAFHDPELACHLESIRFIPELFAIPWFLTVFSHVFPLHKILFLWDQLLLGDASFPFYVGLAVLNQLRDTLMSAGFNECILLFSDLPEVDIERCVKDSVELYNRTPRSITYRQYEKSFEKCQSVLGMTPLPLAQLQAEFCPRISALDLLNLKNKSDEALIVDIRNVDEFNVESLQESINLPFNLVSLSDTVVPQTKEGKMLDEARGKIIIVIGSGGENLIEFCCWLLHCGFPYVSSLHGGIQVLKESNLLS